MEIAHQPLGESALRSIAACRFVCLSLGCNNPPATAGPHCSGASLKAWPAGPSGCSSPTSDTDEVTAHVTGYPLVFQRGSASGLACLRIDRRAHLAVRQTSGSIEPTSLAIRPQICRGSARGSGNTLGSDTRVSLTRLAHSDSARRVRCCSGSSITQLSASNHVGTS